MYLYDILVFSKTQEEHVAHLREVLDRLRSERFYAKLSKCMFNQKSQLGHIVSAEGVQVESRKVEVVKDWPVPKDVSQVRSFLGMTNYFRKFIQNHPSRVTPLTDMTKKSVKWLWSEKCQKAFEDVKMQLTKAPVLVLPDPDKNYSVVCDASGIGIGAVLLQDGHAIAFESRKLTPAEKNYHITDLELLSVVHAMGTWRCYLEGAKGNVTVGTNHRPNTHLPTQPMLSLRQVRWSEFLQRFFLHFKPGKANDVADPLNRYSAFLSVVTRSKGAHQVYATAPHAGEAAHTGKAAGAQQAQKAGGLSQAEGLQRVPPDTELGREIKLGYETDQWFEDETHLADLTIYNGFLWKGDAVVVPNGGDLRKQCIAELHEILYSGHLGIAKTMKEAERLLWLPGMRRDVEYIVRTCDVCQKCKPTNQMPAGKLQPLQISGRRWESGSVDFITHLLLTSRGHSAIVAFVCRLSKMVHFVPSRDDAGAEEVAKLFFANVWKHHGLCRDNVSDRDTKFTSKFWEELCRLLGIKRNMSTAFHPQIDGQTERANTTLEDMLRRSIDPQQSNWDTLLPYAEFAVNNA